MFAWYSPKKFCREFVEAQGHSIQLPAIMAVVSGLKPCSDLWIEAGRVKKFLAACRRYGLLSKIDVHFENIPPSKLPARIIGKANLTTTFAYGKPYTTGRRSGEVHLFIARKREDLELAFGYGWYPVIANDRVIEKPLADAYRFGHALGYPDCCVEFFQKYNDWAQFNFLVEVLKNTDPANASYLCNPFARDVSYSYALHMPCSYHCPRTIVLAGRLRDIIRQEEPLFAQKIDQALQRPFLVFYERRTYAFDGELRDGNIYYREVYFAGNGEDYNLHGRELRKGDCLTAVGGNILVLSGQRCVGVVIPQKMEIGQESPFLAQFGRSGMKVAYGEKR